MPIYTKTGDKGKTSLGSGQRVWKDDPRVNAYGTVDELNALVGVVQASLNARNKGFVKILTTIQNDLFCIGSYLSNPTLEDYIEDLAQHTEDFEKEIDEMTQKMPPLANFILPGGGKAGAHLHHARTVARRSERAVISLAKKEDVDIGVVKYLNRLSDLFFTMARFANYKARKKETIWKM